MANGSTLQVRPSSFSHGARHGGSRSLDTVAKEDAETSRPSGIVGHISSRSDFSRRVGDYGEEDRNYEGEGIMGGDDFD